MLPWSIEPAGRFDEHVISSASSSATIRSATPPTGRCGSTCRPATTTSPTAAIPSIYVIQGLTGQLDMWRNRSALRPNFPELADELFASGEVPPCVARLGRRLDLPRWEPVPRLAGDRRYHSYLCDEVVPFVDERYRTLAAPRASRDHRQVQRRLRRDDHADAPARPVRRPCHPRRRRALRVLLPARLQRDGADAARRLRRVLRALLGGLPLAARVLEGLRLSAP